MAIPSPTKLPSAAASCCSYFYDPSFPGNDDVRVQLPTWLMLGEALRLAGCLELAACPDLQLGSSWLTPCQA